MPKSTISICNKALNTNKAILTTEIFNEINDYINTHNEWGVGIELLIDYLCEEDITISQEQFNTIEAAMQTMGLGGSDRLVDLNGQVQNT